MANRPLFLPAKTGGLVNEVDIDFKWFPGMSVSQKQKSIVSLHAAASELLKIEKILEISTKSNCDIGVRLSAFNLSFITVKYKRCFSVEVAFQASKVFELGGPYQDLLDKTSREAKTDGRLRDSGRLTGFKFFGIEWPLQPKTIFYDWLYINALNKNPDLCEMISEYEGFTDIEFNPNKSINCQARSAAIFVSLQKKGLLSNALKSKDDFIEIYKTEKFNMNATIPTQSNFNMG